MGIFYTKEEVEALMKKPCGQKINHEKQKIDAKFERMESGEEVYFSVSDWFGYFVRKAEENNVKYHSVPTVKEKSVLKSLIENYKPAEIKSFIDTAWDVKHAMMEKDSINIFILSKSFLRTLVPLAEKYSSGAIDKFGVAYDPRLHISKNKNLSSKGGVWVAGIRLA